MTTILTGSYERFLFGFEVGGKEDKPSTLTRSFYVPVHKGPVKCVAAAAPFAATGGTDDCIHLFDVRAHADLGFLMSPGNGAVSALTFYTPPGAGAPSHLLSGTADGGIAVWNAGGEWDCLKTMTDHTKEVTGLAVHPSGKLFLSTARDGHLRLWNLAKGKSQFKTRVGGSGSGATTATPDAVAWAPGPAPDTYALLAGPTITVHTVAGEGKAVACLGAAVDSGAPATGRLGAFAWMGPHTLAGGGEDGAVLLWDTRVPSTSSSSSSSSASSPPVLTIAGAHATRIKGVAPIWWGAGADVDGSATTTTAGLLCAGSADGAVKVWDARAPTGGGGGAPASAGGALPAPPAPLATASAAGARLTCLATISTAAPNRAGTKLTPQQKSRRAKREAAAASAAKVEAGEAPPPDPDAPRPEWGVRTPVRTLSAKERRKALREALNAEGRAAKAKAKNAARNERKAAVAAAIAAGLPPPEPKGSGGGVKRAASPPPQQQLTKKQKREAKLKKEARTKKKEKARAKRKEEKKAAYVARKATAGKPVAAAGGGDKRG